MVLLFYLAFPEQDRMETIPSDVSPVFVRIYSGIDSLCASQRQLLSVLTSHKTVLARLQNYSSS